MPRTRSLGYGLLGSTVSGKDTKGPKAGLNNGGGKSKGNGPGTSNAGGNGGGGGNGTQDQALVQLTVATTASPMSFTTEVLDTSNIWTLTPNPTRLNIPANSTYARLTSGLNGAALVEQMAGSGKNGAGDFVGRLMGGGFSNNAASMGSASSAIFAVTGSDYYEITSPLGQSYTAWAGLETLPSTKGYGLLTNSVQQIIPPGWNTISFDTEAFDALNMHSAGAPTKFIVPSGTSGIMRFGCGAQSYLTVLEWYVRIIKNGTTVYANNYSPKSVEGCSTWTYPMAVTAGDEFEMQVYVSGASFAVRPTTGLWFCYEECDAALKFCVAALGAGGDAVGTNTDEELLWGAEIVDTDGFHSTVTNTGRLTIPGGLGITKARLSFSLQGGGANSGNRTIAQVDRVSSGINGTPRQACQTGGQNQISGFGSWIPATAGDSFYMRIYGGARTFAQDPASWFCIEVK